ncbi:uncharacterized protein LOC144146492 [Haemaphysalis longicornis]
MAGQTFTEDNPALGIYQNEAKCFVLDDTWYIMYRSSEYDPFYGGLPTCVQVTSAGTSENGASEFTVEVGGTDRVNVTASMMSSPGYEVPNVINVVVDESRGCSLRQPKQALDKDITCCHFVYDLVCGTSKKYQLYDECK